MPFLENPNGAIFFRKVGLGSKIIIALHGYGRDGTDFLTKELWQDAYTLYTIDLPFHGASNWQQNHYNKTQLLEIITLLLQQEGIHQFIAVGHSLGGRLWLTIAPYLSEHLIGLWLLAPDGIATHNMRLLEHLPTTFRTALSIVLSYPKTILKNS